MKFYQLSYFSCHCYMKDMVEKVEDYKFDKKYLETLSK
jgi:hypothetical protein